TGMAAGSFSRGGWREEVFAVAFAEQEREAGEVVAVRFDAGHRKATKRVRDSLTGPWSVAGRPSRNCRSLPSSMVSSAARLRFTGVGSGVLPVQARHGDG